MVSALILQVCVCNHLCGCFFFLNQVLEEKPKQRRSRSKSKDTPPPGQQNSGMDWQPPKGKQTKSRSRKSKKSDANADPDLERQQQMLQQQLYQQMEQRHRLIQQKQGVIVEQGQQPGQQPPIPLNQHMVDNPGLLAQPPVDVSNPMRPLSHTPELSQRPPSRPDSQISLPLGAPGPQMPLPPSTQIPPGYPQTSDQGSFSQRFPTPEHYLQQFGQHPMHPQRQPTVQYVAEANNPFSDKFQGLQSRGRGRGGARKKSGAKKAGKSSAKKAVQPAPSSDAHQQQQQQQQQQLQQVNVVLQEPASPWHDPTPSPVAHGIKHEQVEAEGVVPESLQVQNNTEHTDPHTTVPLETPKESKDNNDALVQEGKSGKSNSSEPFIEPCSFISSNEKGSSNSPPSGEPKHDISVAEESKSDTAAPVEQEANESAGKNKGPCNGTGLEALQKLESMVADMANEEEACKELEKQSELERLQLQLDEDDFDPEMDKMYEGDFMEDTPFERSLVSPNKTVNNGSQANSVASLECHEESLISPLLEESEKRKDRQKFFAETLYNDSVSVEKKVPDVCRREPASEQQSKEQTSVTPSAATDPIPTSVTVYNTLNPNAAESVAHVINSGFAEADQSKHIEESLEENLGDSTQNPREEMNSQEAVEKQTPQGSASAQNCPEKLEQGCETGQPESFASQTFESTAGELTQAKDQPDQPTKRTILAPVTPVVRPVVNNGNGSFPLTQEGTNHQQTPDIHDFVNSVRRDVCQALPQQTDEGLASCIAPEAVHETVSQIPTSLNCPQLVQLQETTPTIPTLPVQREKPVKTPKQPSRTKNQHPLSDTAAKKKPLPKEEDPIKKQLQELRRQEYERKKREYEEQQKKKRALQMKLRIEKQLIREQRKRQRIYMNTSNRSKQKTEVRNNVPSLKISTPSITHKEIKPAAPLSLCEPKLLLTHALSHPYGSRPFNGQCLLKGNFGSAKVDGIVDYYSQFPTSEVDIVVGHPPTPPSSLPPSPGLHQQKNDSSGKPLVNGDASLEERERTEALAMSKAHGQDNEFPAKRARFMASVDSARGNVSVPPSMPTPPLSDSAATVNDRLAGKQLSYVHADTNGKESNSNSLSSSPETVQYIASSSPESDALNRVHTPKFSALLHRDSTDSPVFPAVTIKREKVEHYLENGVSRSCAGACSSVSDTHILQSNCKLEGCHGSRVENDSDDLDNIHVTLTLSPTSEQRVTDTVASVADLIGCSPPRHSDIVIEPSGKTVASTGYLMPHSLTTGDKLTSSIAPMAHTSSDIYQKSPFPCSQINLSSTEDSASRKKPEGPYCRHCDVLIIGIGVKRKPDDKEGTEKPTTIESSEIDTESADYKIYRVNVEAGDCTGDIFCSDACLKQYFAHVGSECSSLTQEPKSELNALQPCVDVLVSSEGQTSVGAGNVTSLNETDTRGGVIADGLSPAALRKIRNPSWKEEEDDEVRTCFVFVRVNYGPVKTKMRIFVVW